jgi:hypothetical protein
MRRSPRGFVPPAGDGRGATGIQQKEPRRSKPAGLFGGLLDLRVQPLGIAPEVGTVVEDAALEAGETDAAVVVLDGRMDWQSNDGRRRIRRVGPIGE